MMEEVEDQIAMQLSEVSEVLGNPPKENKTQKNEKAVDRHRHLRLPLARVKNIMKQDPQCQMISQDAAFLIAKATELFIEMMSRETTDFTQQTKRKTVLIRDLEKTISNASNLCFLDGMLETS